MSPHTTPASETDEALRAVLTRTGRELAARTRREQGLPPQVENVEAIDGFVELWQRAHRPRHDG